MKPLLSLLLLFPFLAAGQFSDDFSDGDISDNPTWQGDTEIFTVNGDSQLQLWDDKESSAFIATAQHRSDSTEWLFNAELQFSPSANNNARIYLVADAGSPSTVNKAVFLRLGESGSDDALSLVFLNGQEEVEICRGTAGLISSSFNLNIKITFRPPGIWRIYFDPLNNGNYVLDAEGFHTLDFASSYFIVQCTYTISNSQDFIFDDFMVRPFQLDVQPPEVEQTELISDHEIEISFSEPVSESSAMDRFNYLLDNQINPTEVVVDEMLNDQVKLIFDAPFQNNSVHTLAVSGVEDIQGNVMAVYETSFTYLVPFQPAAGEVVVNELMVDVNPEPDGLPPYDYIELYNTTDKMIDMAHSVVSWGSHHREIPEGTHIEPGGFLLLGDDNADYGEDVEVVDYSSLPLNTETLLVLKNADQQVLHALDYKKEWYHDEDKKEGGWSLEMIDPVNRCGGQLNYKASEDEDGGTPGNTNSVFGTNPDTSAPTVRSIAFESESSLKMIISEPMDSLAVSNSQNYRLSPPGITPEMVTAQPPFYNEVIIHFPQSVYQENTLFELETNGLYDCSGNSLLPGEVRFSTYQAGFGDILITEVMADVNPAPLALEAVEYVELHNQTAFPLDLSGWHLYVNDDAEAFAEGTLIEANQFLVIVGAPMPGIDPSRQVVISGLSITNDGCQVYLTDKEQQLIHYLNYQREWLSDPLKQEGGWSAEMIDYQNYCGTAYNWDASNAPAGGTPGAPNSISGKNPDNFPPDILRVAALSENSIRIYFDELMDVESLLPHSIYTVAPGLSVVETQPVIPSHNAIDLVFDQVMNPETIYQLSLEGTPCDCVGNRLMLSEEVNFTYPLIADTADLVINEIMFNTSDDNEDFLEVYNISEKAIDLSSIFLSLKDPFTGEVKKKVAVSSEKIILLKGGFAVLSDSERKLHRYYPNAPKRNLLTVDGFPDFPSKEGLVVLQTISNQPVDSIYYHEDLHFGLLSNYQNISLERISLHTASNVTNNWHSASEAHGFATPGAMNSQHVSKSGGGQEVEVLPDIISPDNDGKDDVVMITLRLEKAGYSANIYIYDAKGRQVSRLANNYLLGTDNALYWDGTNSNNQLVSSGYYIIYLEVFNLEGNIQQYKKTVVVTSE